MSFAYHVLRYNVYYMKLRMYMNPNGKYSTSFHMDIYCLSDHGGRKIDGLTRENYLATMVMCIHQATIVTIFVHA